MEFSSQRSDRILFFTFIAVLVFLYVFGHNRYMVEHIDDAWTLSWAKTWWDTGNVYDVTFGYIDGDGGTALFSRSYVFLYGALLRFVDWGRGWAFAVSTVFILASAYLWGRIVKKLGYSQALSRWFPLVMLILEAYFAAAHKTRVDAMAFFLATSAFALFVHERYLFSGLIALIGAETHPFALTAFMYIFAYLFILWPLMKEKPREYVRKALLFTVGAFLGLGYYLALHYPWLNQIGDLSGRIHGNVFTSYLFKFRYAWRHLPEAAAWLLALFLFIKARRWKNDRFILPFIILTSLSTFLLPHGNFHYMIYLYPPLILLILEESERLRIREWTMLALLILMIPQYGWLFWTQRNFNYHGYIAELRERVPETPDFVYGNANVWFALNNREFHGPSYFNRAGLEPEDWPEEFLVVENRELERNNGWKDLDRGKELYKKNLIDEWDYYDGSPVRIWLMSRRVK